MTALHRFTRRVLWHLAGIFAVLLVAAWILGAGTVWQIAEWIPMTVAVLLVGRHVASFIRQRG